MAALSLLLKYQPTRLQPFGVFIDHIPSFTITCQPLAPPQTPESKHECMILASLRHLALQSASGGIIVGC